MHGVTLARIARTMLVAAAAALIASGAALAQDETPVDPWAPGAQWLTLRAGYAKSTVDGTGNGGPGYGVAYSRMLSGLAIRDRTLFRHWSIGASVGHEVVGHFGPASEIDVPATVEMLRHYAWNSDLKPYFGVGLAGHYRKTYRTGDDLREVSLGWFLSGGANVQVATRSLVGLDVRMSRLDASQDPPNPVFGYGSGTLERDGSFTREKGTHWSVKLGWSFVY